MRAIMLPKRFNRWWGESDDAFILIGGQKSVNGCRKNDSGLSNCFMSALSNKVVYGRSNWFIIHYIFHYNIFVSHNSSLLSLICCSVFSI